jgi:hypothetical protein
VKQFRFQYFPLVQEITSVVHYLPCICDAFSLCLFTGISVLGVYFSDLSLFSVAVSVFHQPPLLSVCYDGLLFIFQFCGAVWLWVLLTSSRNELCDPLPALLWGVAYRLPALCLPVFLVFVY